MEKKVEVVIVTVLVEVACETEGVTLWVVDSATVDLMLENRPVHNVVPKMVEDVTCPFDGEVEASIVDENTLNWVCPLCLTAHDMDRADPDEAADLLAERGW